LMHTKEGGAVNPENLLRAVRNLPTSHHGN
jgi:hypothetical protein